MSGELSPKEQAFMHRLGRHLRKQEGWWDDKQWWDLACDLAERWEALPRDYAALDVPDGEEKG